MNIRKCLLPLIAVAAATTLASTADAQRFRRSSMRIGGGSSWRMPSSHSVPRTTVSSSKPATIRISTAKPVAPKQPARLQNTRTHFVRGNRGYMQGYGYTQPGNNWLLYYMLFHNLNGSPAGAAQSGPTYGWTDMAGEPRKTIGYICEPKNGELMVAFNARCAVRPHDYKTKPSYTITYREPCRGDAKRSTARQIIDQCGL